MSEVLPETILLIEDGQADAGLFYETLREQSADSTTLVHLGLMSDAETYLARNTVDIILLDVRLPDVQGLEAVRRAHAAAQVFVRKLYQFCWHIYGDNAWDVASTRPVQASHAPWFRHFLVPQSAGRCPHSSRSHTCPWTDIFACEQRASLCRL